MILDVETAPARAATASLLARIETRVRESTHNRIRNLSVEEVEGRFVVGGQVASHHMRQLALHGALELLSGDQFASEIVVLAAGERSISG